MSLPKFSLAGKKLFPAGESLVSDIILLPARESLDSDIPARDGEIDNLFYSVAFYTYMLSWVPPPYTEQKDLVTAAKALECNGNTRQTVHYKSERQSPVSNVRK